MRFSLPRWTVWAPGCFILGDAERVASLATRRNIQRDGRFPRRKTARQFGGLLFISTTIFLCHPFLLPSSPYQL